MFLDLLLGISVSRQTEVKADLLCQVEFVPADFVNDQIRSDDLSSKVLTERKIFQKVSHLVETDGYCVETDERLDSYWKLQTVELLCKVSFDIC